MSRQAQWAKTARIQLIIQLGATCQECGCTRIRKLEIDHIHGRTYNLSKLGSHNRITIYRKEAQQGLIQVLCRKCNARKQFKHNHNAQQQFGI